MSSRCWPGWRSPVSACSACSSATSPGSPWSRCWPLDSATSPQCCSTTTAASCSEWPGCSFSGRQPTAGCCWKSRAVGPEHLAQLSQLLGLRQLGQPVGARVALAHAVVVDRPHVQPAELEDQEHLGRPAADAPHAGEPGHDLVVRHPILVAERDGAVEHSGRQVLDRGCLGTGQTRRAKLLERHRVHRGRRRPAVEQGQQAAVDRGRGGPGQLLVHDRAHQGRELVLHRRPGREGADPLDQARHGRVPAGHLGGPLRDRPRRSRQANSCISCSNWSSEIRNSTSARSRSGVFGRCSVVAKSSMSLST